MVHFILRWTAPDGIRTVGANPMACACHVIFARSVYPYTNAAIYDHIENWANEARYSSHVYILFIYPTCPILDTVVHI